MCDPTSIAVVLALGGTAATAYGQHQAGQAQKRAIHEEVKKQKAIRKKSLAQAEEVVNQADPTALRQDIDQSRGAAAQEADQAGAIARTFAGQAGAAPGGGDAFQGAITDAAVGAARDAGRTGQREATQAGFSEALARRAQLLRRLGAGNELLREDSRRSAATLPGRMAAAGEQGSLLRLVGGLSQAGGYGALENGAWAASPGNPASGLVAPTGTATGTGRRVGAVGRGGYAPRN